MSSVEIANAVSSGIRAHGHLRSKADFFHPVVDFLCLGGGSLIVIAIISGLLLVDGLEYATVAATSLMLAHVINNPHFAHSYQLFYRNFRTKAFGAQQDPILKMRYFFAGIALPVALIVFFFGTITSGSVPTLAIAANAMTFLVGWHYVKQGYGILIATSVRAKRFFSSGEKQILLTNAYSCWISFWLAVNWLVTERNLWGIKHYMLPVPTLFLVIALSVSAATTASMIAMLSTKWHREKALPVNGIVAYLTTLYVWLSLMIDPIFVLIVPACHSVQYLTVVWRYQLNLETDIQQSIDPTAESKPYSESMSFRFGVFITLGMILGYFGFWAAPRLLDSIVPYDKALFGSTLFLYVFWIFINIHHYAIDNVMWRKGNRDTGKYLFS